MAFVIGSADSFSYHVTLPRLNDDGSISRQKISVKFKRLPSDEARDVLDKDFDPVMFAEMLERANGDKDLANMLVYAESLKAGKANKKVAEATDELMQIMSGWSDVADEAGPLEFNRSNLEMLLQFSGPAYQAIKEAYREAISSDGKRKN